MGYLYDNLPFGRKFADCPALYEYALIVEYEQRDLFMYPPPDDKLGLIIKEVLPDVEDWQFSVIRAGRVKFRFHDTGQRETARVRLLGDVGSEIRVTDILYQNPPDQLDRGEEEP